MMTRQPLPTTSQYDVDQSPRLVALALVLIVATVGVLALAVHLATNDPGLSPETGRVASPSGSDAQRRDVPSLAEAVDSVPAGVTASWYEAVSNDIAEAEYAIGYSASRGAYTSPNRARGLRVEYRADGFVAAPRADSAATWRVELSVVGIDRGGAPLTPSRVALDSGDARICVAGGAMSVQHEGFRIDYRNDTRGMRQNFVVEQRPDGDGALRVRLASDGDLEPRVDGEDDILFVDADGVGRMSYSDLTVWDATGRELAASVETSGTAIALVVDDRDALYPVTVDPISTSADWMVESNQSGAGLGVSVAGAGDVNGDGYDDVLVGAPSYENGQYQEGAAFLYLGSNSGLTSTSSWLVEGNLSSAGMGSAVASAGDVNGDGYSDVLIGAPSYDQDGSGPGAYGGTVFLFLGGSGGPSTTADWSVSNANSNSLFGWRLGTAGDVNGDGYDDVAVGAKWYTNGQLREGAAYVYHGTSTTPSTTPNWSVESNQSDAEIGHAIGSAGDVNGDGYGDLVVGAVWYDNGETSEGRAWVYHGSSTGLSTTSAWSVEGNEMFAGYGCAAAGAGDVNADGYGDVIVGAFNATNGQTSEGRAFVYHGSASGLATTAAWSFEPNASPQGNYGFGWCVGSAGDLNGDGYDDVVAGSPGFTDGQVGEGRGFAFLGSPDGLETTAIWTTESNQGSAYFAYSIAGAGDVNGDGYDDVVAGAYGYDNGQTNEGRAYVYHGAGSASITLTSPNGGETFCHGTTRDVTWTSTGITSVKVEVSLDGGATYSTITSSTPAAGGSYAWTISSDYIGEDCRVRVSDATNAAVNDVSDAVFLIDIPPTLEVTFDKPVLWPPDHSLVPVTATVTPIGGADPHFTLLGIESAEAESGLGAGDVGDDIQGEVIGTADVAFSLRAERAQSGRGRVYTVRYRLTDLGGFQSDYAWNVVVPHTLGTLATIAPGTQCASLAPIRTGSGGAILGVNASAATAVTLSVYDTKGRELARLIDNMTIGPGGYALQWHGTTNAGLAPGTAVSAGTYLAVLQGCGAPVFRAFRIE